MWNIIDYIQLKLKGYRYLGHVRYKDDSLAPKEWKTNLWQKLKNNDLLNPININHSENFKEFRIFVKGKVIIIAINVFLYSFIYSFAKDSYALFQAKHNLNKIEQIDFKKQIPTDLQISYNWKKFKLSQINDKEKIKQLKNEINISNKYIYFIEEKLKHDYFENNYSIIKSNIISFGNNLIIIYMILKYYWKKKKTPN